ncbi:MAG: hypothetical protein WDO13_03985 [Verrucomicrobiota bacterium]
MLPVLVMNWMFWIPAITLVYAMPTVLQTAPLHLRHRHLGPARRGHRHAHRLRRE